jgi:hypothetical protein
MNLRKGILRIGALTLWLAFGTGVVFAMLPLFELISALEFLCLLTIFEVGFYLPVLVIVRMNSAYPLREQVFDSDSISFKLVLIISAIAGVIGFSIYSHIEPYGTHVAPYMGSFLAPFMLAFGSYIYVCWIVQGFQSAK